MKYGIRHSADHTWWLGSVDAHGDRWTLNPRLARDFSSRPDALAAASLECHARPEDYDAIPLPTSTADAHLGGLDA